MKKMIELTKKDDFGTKINDAEKLKKKYHLNLEQIATIVKQSRTSETVCKKAQNLVNKVDRIWKDDEEDEEDFYEEDFDYEEKDYSKVKEKGKKFVKWFTG